MGCGLAVASKARCEGHVCYPQGWQSRLAWFGIFNEKHLETHSRHSGKHVYTLHTFSPAPNKTADPMVRPCPAAARSHSNRQLSLPLIQQEDSTVQSDCSEFLKKWSKAASFLGLAVLLTSYGSYVPARNVIKSGMSVINWSSKMVKQNIPNFE